MNFSQLQTVDPERAQWHLHTSLLMQAYKDSPDSLKKKIAFIALNYLGKAGPFSISEMPINGVAKAQLKPLFQSGLLKLGTAYNRESPMYNNYLLPYAKQKLAKGAADQLYVVDTPRCTSALELWFKRLTADNLETLEQLFRPHVGQYKDYLKHPITVDLTEELEDWVHKREPDEAIRSWEEHINEKINAVVEKLTQDECEKNKLKIFILSNLNCICRTEIEGAGLIIPLPLFTDPSFYQIPKETTSFLGCKSPRSLLETKKAKWKVDFNNFANVTGMRLGAVKGRKILTELYSLEELIERESGTQVTFPGKGANAIYYPDQKKFLESAQFSRFSRQLNQLNRAPHLQVLGDATLKLVEGCIQSINDKTWQKINSQPESRLILQTALFCIHQHLARAEETIDDFKMFAQYLEYVHYELSTLLCLVQPFSPEDYKAIYRERLDSVPASLKGHVKAGIAKSAMNALAGVNAAIHRMTPNPRREFDPESHFEIIEFLNERKNASSHPHVDLYIGEFNHNINLDPDHQEYHEANLIEKIKELKGSHPLTVAVDCTIDYIDSPKVKKLLETFEQDILDGHLNFVFYRSGQKFEMFGMDAYYGSPYYIINNGADQWRAFQDLEKDPAFTTDLLSLQWFALVNQYAPKQLDQYRALIFNNSRHITSELQNIHTKNPKVSFPKVREGMEFCYVDIKVKGGEGEAMLVELQDKLYTDFAKRGAKIHSKGGYGYLHPNITLFPTGLDPNKKGATLRINPGVNGVENQWILHTIQEWVKAD